MAHPSFNDVAKRMSSIQKAFRDGKLSPSQSQVLKEGYAVPYADNTLAMGRSGAAEPGSGVLFGDPDIIGFTLTVLQEDRDGDIVIPMGCHLENFAKNPGIYFGHQQWEVPIGVSKSKEG